MPSMLNTPEDWLRKHKRNLYFFEFSASFNDNSYQEDQNSLRALIKSEFPDVAVEELGPSDESGWIVGGPTVLVVDFSPEEIQSFSKKWEDEKGKSKDPRWQCYVLNYQKWIIKNEYR